MTNETRGTAHNVLGYDDRNPLDVIFELRRYEILTESTGPADWTPMFTSLENQGSVWQVPDARDAWKNDF